MFSRVIKALRPSGRSNFDAYLGNLSKSGSLGTPTADEARRDYASAVKAAGIGPGY